MNREVAVGRPYIGCAGNIPETVTSVVPLSVTWISVPPIVSVFTQSEKVSVMGKSTLVQSKFTPARVQSPLPLPLIAMLPLEQSLVVPAGTAPENASFTTIATG